MVETETQCFFFIIHLLWQQWNILLLLLHSLSLFFHKTTLHYNINNGFSNLRISTIIKKNQSLLGVELVMVYCWFACVAGTAGFGSRWSWDRCCCIARVRLAVATSRWWCWWVWVAVASPIWCCTATGLLDLLRRAWMMDRYWWWCLLNSVWG